MVELTRAVRFFLGGCGETAPEAGRSIPSAINGFSAFPAARGLAHYYQLSVRCRGPVDPVTGYFLNIKHIDQAVREHAIPLMGRRQAEHQVQMGRLMQQLIEVLGPPLDHTVVGLCLELSPHYHIEIRSDDMAHVLVTQQFEFSAAHRLHATGLSAQGNRRIFGKCNNPSGHGHNYRVQVALRCPIQEQGSAISIDKLDAMVDESAIAYLDHKHLNLDIPEFAQRNPSVENIAILLYDRLKQPVAALDLHLDAVTVWETSRTMCTYRGT